MCGFGSMKADSAKINFVVPKVDVLRKLNETSAFNKDNIRPGLLLPMIDVMQQHNNGYAYKLCVDGMYKQNCTLFLIDKKIIQHD